MKPENYLTDTGKKIFDRLVKMLKSKIEDIDVFQLSQLADAIDLNQRACYAINYPEKGTNQKDGVQRTPNGYTQVTGQVTVRDKTQKTIDTLSARFGLTPGDREKIKTQDEKKKHKRDFKD